MSGILGAIEISSQGLSVQRKKMNVVAENMANAETTRTPEGGPYRRQRVVVEQDEVKGTFNSMLNTASVKLARTSDRHMTSHGYRSTDGVDLPTVEGDAVVDPDAKFRLVYDPSHPDADEDGYVQMPDVEIVTEMVDMMAASRAYEANTVAISAAKNMAKDALDI
ncbi:MAG TPA: flagellar basal body rod protein FlgC [candidate division Zixibacteria bacterium]|nr:flagellar basal body rod protein FlgC [candidate division Zixibacteria bacterium]